MLTAYIFLKINVMRRGLEEENWENIFYVSSICRENLKNKICFLSWKFWREGRVGLLK
jgi:hypothetical protein